MVVIESEILVSSGAKGGGARTFWKIEKSENWRFGKQFENFKKTEISVYVNRI